MPFQANDTGGVSTEGSGTALEAPSHEGTEQKGKIWRFEFPSSLSPKVSALRALSRGAETFKCALPESPASSDLEDCVGQTTASRVEGVNREDCTEPLKRTSAGAV